MLCPWFSPCRICFSKSKARELLADLDPLCLEPRLGTCSLALGAKETGVDPKYLGIYWIAGLSTRTSVSVTGRGPPPCLAKWNGHFCYHRTSRYWVNGNLLKLMNWTWLHPLRSSTLSLHWRHTQLLFLQWALAMVSQNAFNARKIADWGSLFGFLLNLLWSRQGFYSSHSFLFKWRGYLGELMHLGVITYNPK